jgi:hypothetical protein
MEENLWEISNVTVLEMESGMKDLFRRRLNIMEWLRG